MKTRNDEATSVVLQKLQPASTDALRDDELDHVAGGDVYMHHPRGSDDRLGV